MKKSFLNLVIRDGQFEDFEFRKIKDDGSWFLKGGKSSVRVKKRNSYPKSFLFEGDGFFITGYIEPSLFSGLKEETNKKENLVSYIKSLREKLDKEYLFILIDKTEKEVRVYRDFICTLPIFYFKDQNCFALSNKFTNLLSFLGEEVELDFPTLSEQLMGLSTSFSKTVLSEIKILGSGKTLLKSQDRLEVEGFEVSFPEEKCESVFEKRLRKTFSRWEEKIKGRGEVGFEMSGGVDSSTLPFFVENVGFKSFSMILPGEEGRTQKERLKEVSNFLDLKPYFLDITGLYPLKSQKEGIYPFYPLREIYFESLSELARKAEDEKIEVMITGMGGDEAFIVDPGEEGGYPGLAREEGRSKINFPKFFTKRLKDNLLRSSLKENSFSPVVPYSVLAANVARNNIYIEKGIWPVAPLADPYFVRFCRTLPKKLREKKKVLRRWQRERGYPSAVYNPNENEDFSSFFDKAMKKHNKELSLIFFQALCFLSWVF